MFYKSKKTFLSNFKIAGLILILFGLLLSPVFAEENTDYNIWQLSDSYSLDARSMFMNDSGDVVWTVWTGFLYEIFYFDSSNLVLNSSNDSIVSTIQITSDSSTSNYHPVISDNGDIAWDSNGQIYLYSGGTINQISSSSTNSNTTPVVNSDGDIVWVGRTGTLSTTTEIYSYDGSITQITSNALRDSAPDISSSGSMVWQERIGSYWQVFYRDSSGTVTQVSNGSFSSQSAQINSGSEIVWQGADNNIYLSIAGSMPTAIGTGVSPQINSNGDIVWRDGSDIKLYKDGVTTTIATNATLSTVPHINDNGLIVWSGTDGENPEIFYYTGIETVQLTYTDVAVSNLDPFISLTGEISWLGEQDGIGKVYFAAPIVIPVPEPLSCLLFAAGAMPLALRLRKRK